MEVEISAVAVLLAAFSAMVVGSVWYANAVFGKDWRKLLKLSKEKEKQMANKAILRAVFTSIVSAYILAYLIEIAVVYFSDRSELSVSISIAFLVWLGFYLSHMYMQDAFEQRPGKLTAINAGNMLATLLVMGAVIGLVAY